MSTYLISSTSNPSFLMLWWMRSSSSAVRNPSPVSHKTRPLLVSIKNGCTCTNKDPGLSLGSSFCGSKGINFLLLSTEKEPSKREYACIIFYYVVNMRVILNRSKYTSARLGDYAYKTVYLRVNSAVKIC